MAIIYIITIILSLLIGANLFCGCCKYPIFDFMNGLIPGTGSGSGAKNSGKEGLGTKKDESDAQNDINMVNDAKNPIPPAVIAAADANPAAAAAAKKSGFTGNSESAANAAPRNETISNVAEGMSTLGSSLGEVPNGDLASSWISKATSFASEFGYGNINNTGTAYTGTPVPLPDGELVIFAQNKSKPECCPSPYSTSSGCMCMTPEQINYLNTRGGNRTSDSEY